MSGAGRHAQRPALLPADGPLRRTHRSPAEMTRRAWKLVGLHLAIPGSAQLVAGNRLLGRAAVAVWVALLAVLVAAGLTWLVQRDVLVGVATSATGLTALQITLLVLAVAWLGLTLDTLRLARVLRLTAWARPLVAASLVLLAVGGSSAAAFGAYASGVARGTLVSVFPAAAPSSVQAAKASVDHYDVLLLGLDRPSRGGAIEPQSISVVSVSVKTGRATIIGVPTTLRDVPFPADSPFHRLYPNGYRSCTAAPCTIADVYREAQAAGTALYPNAAADGTTPGVEALREAVSGVLGRDVPYTVRIGTTAFGRLVDALGGVDLTIPAAIPKNGAVAAFPAGRAHLNGARAVAYLRSPVAAATAAQGQRVTQLERTLQVETALLEQANPANVLLQFRTIAAAGSGAVRTDLPQQTVTDLTVLALKSHSAGIAQVRLVPPTVPDVTKPDFAAIHRLVAASAD